LALASFGVKKWEDAKRYAEQVLSAHPDDREMNLILTDIALNNEHNLAAAKTHVNNCFKLNPKDPAAFYYLGMVLKMEGDIRDAIQNLSKSVEENPSNANAQAALGSLCLQTGNVICAVPALEKATQLAPEESQHHYQLALAYTRAGAADKAKEQLALYQQMKAKELKDAKDSKGPATSEVPPMGIGSRP
jgi:Flp pilus assembly protein TadD